MPNDRKLIKSSEGEEGLTAKDLEYIIEVNKKSIEINIEVEKQNEQVISKLEDINEKLNDIIINQNDIKNEQKDLKRIVDEEIKKKVDTNQSIEDTKELSEESNKILKDTIEDKVEEIEKNLFRLVIILGSAGVGTIITIIQSLLHK